LGSKLVRGKKTLHPSEQETLESWGHRNLGTAATRFLLGPAMQGIYANEVSGLSSDLILSPLFSPRKEKYRGLLTGPGGMQDLVDHLESKVLSLGVKIHFNSSPLLEDLQGPVVIATSAAAASTFTRNKFPDLSAILSTIRMTSLISVTLFFEKAQTSYKGFGCLIPRGFNLKTFGILMNSYIFKDRDKNYNETWILGGIRQEELLQLSDSDLLKLLAQERYEVLGRKDSLLDFKINRWKNALPYYDLTLEKAQKDLKSKETPDLFLHGNYLSGIGLSKILDRSDWIAQQIGNKYG
jgi:oxygen-dependent protoporphyrinogen oxidase